MKIGWDMVAKPCPALSLYQNEKKRSMAGVLVRVEPDDRVVNIILPAQRGDNHVRVAGLFQDFHNIYKFAL